MPERVQLTARLQRRDPPLSGPSHILLLVKKLSELDRISLLSNPHKPLCFPAKQKERLRDSFLPQAHVQFRCSCSSSSVYPHHPLYHTPSLRSLGQQLKSLLMRTLLYPHSLWQREEARIPLPVFTM